MVRNSLSYGVAPSIGRERGTTNDQFKKDLPQLQNGVGKVSAEIEIFHTETLLKEVHLYDFWANVDRGVFWFIYLVVLTFDFWQVEKVFDSSHPDLLEIEKAKKMLKVRTEMDPKKKFHFPTLVWH